MRFLKKSYENEFTEEYIAYNNRLFLQTEFTACLTYKPPFRFARMTHCVVITSNFVECLLERTLLWRNAFFQCRFENVVFLSSVLSSSFVRCAFYKCSFVDCKIGGIFTDCTQEDCIAAKNYIVASDFPEMQEAENKITATQGGLLC